MKISRIELGNFRQFHGQQALDLAYDDVRNVTVVHAENGVGKTTLLNAVYWTFFGKVTERFEQPDELVNFSAKAEGASSAAINVRFEFDGTDYVAQRRSQPGGTPSFSVAKIDGGAMRPVPAPDTFMGSMIPLEMARYFFFDGEHAERFAAYGNSDAGPAIRAMLGCDLAERAVKDLNAAASHYMRQIGNVPGDNEASALQAQLARFEQEQERDELALADDRRSIEELKAQKERIEEELRRTAATREIQVMRDSLEAQLRGVEAALKSAEGDVVRWIGRASTVAVVGRRLADVTLDFIDEEALRGRIPSPYNETFIQSLLSSRRCICGCDLKPETDEWAAVSDLLKSAGNAEALNRAVRARAQLRIMKDNAASAPTQLEAARSRVTSELERRRRLEQDIGEQSRKLENFSIDEGVSERKRGRASSAASKR